MPDRIMQVRYPDCLGPGAPSQDELPTVRAVHHPAFNCRGRFVVLPNPSIVVHRDHVNPSAPALVGLGSIWEYRHAIPGTIKALRTMQRLNDGL